MIELNIGDCLDVLKEMEDNSIHAIVTDPPYGLSEHSTQDAFDCLNLWIKGEEFAHNKKGFMGRSWDGWVPGPEIWKECYRVLKPGGSLLVFTGTRSVDLMGIAIRLSGFRILQCIIWVFGSGFPKSTDLSKQIDKKFNAERKVVGRHHNPARNKKMKTIFSDDNYEWVKSDGLNITESATEEARKWDGWKYSISPLKPALEVIFWAQKPYEGKPVDSIMKHEVGAFNIDECRVGLNNEKPPSGSAKRIYKSNDYTDDKIYGDNKNTPISGRYPANLLLGHSPGCRKVGKKKVKGTKPHPVYSNVDKYEGWGNITKKKGEIVNKYEDEDGNETIDDWECVDGCAVKALGEQSGESSSLSYRSPDRGGSGASLMFSHSEGGIRDIGDSGTAARFFNQFQFDDDPFFYCAKTSKKERDAGCEGLEYKSAGEVTGGRKEGSAGLDCPGSGAGRKSGNYNYHPTVKPLKLMQWLIKLVTREGQTVLDPFMGSGSTGCAAVLEKRDFIGIELDEEYVKIAEARIKYWESTIKKQPLKLESNS